MAFLSVPAGLEPSVAGAIWRYRWLVVVLAVVGAAAGFGYTRIASKVYTASATLVATSTNAQLLLGSTSAGDAQQGLVSDSVLLQSPLLAARAATLANQQLGRRSLRGTDITADLVVQQASSIGVQASSAASTASSQPTDLIQITFSAPGPKVAAAGANGVLHAFAEMHAAIVRNEATAALAELNSSLTSVTGQLTQVNNNLSALSNKLALEAIAAQRAQALGQRVPTTSSDLEAQTLTAQQAALQSREGAISTQIGTVQLNEQLALAQPAGVVPAVAPKTPSSPSRIKDTLLGFLVGLLLGVVLSYPLALRRQRFRSRHEPELLYNAPLLGDVPLFESEGPDGSLPVSERPRSPSAEAFRYVATALRNVTPDDVATQVVVTSAHSGDGKTIVAANTALALAESGLRVLAVDGDAINHALTGLLVGDESDAIHAKGDAGTARFSSLPIDGELRVVDMGRGVEQALAEGAADIVVIDAPPLLEAAAASDMAARAGHVVVVLNHHDLVRAHLEPADMLVRLDVQVMGYVYNRAPLDRNLGAYYRPNDRSPRAEASQRQQPTAPAPPISISGAPDPNGAIPDWTVSR